MQQNNKSERIAKVIARAGVCSRRDAEKLILEGRVKVKGEILTSPAFLIDNDKDILIDNKPLNDKQPTRVWCYYKPTGYVTTHKDPEGRPTVFDILKTHKLPRVISIGRLDLNSEGLLLLTNDGEFARFAELPTTHWPRSYKVRVFGDLDINALLNLKNGIEIDGIRYKGIEVEVTDTKSAGSNKWLIITLYEGKNREIRRIMEHFGLEVNRLIRISYGPFLLKDLKVNEIYEISQKEIKKLCT